MDRNDEEVFVKHAAELTRFATGIVGPFEAHDVVSTAFLNCVQAGRWPTIEDKRAYLFRAVVNEAKSVRRTAWRRNRREFWYSVTPLEPETEWGESPRPEIIDAVRQLSLRQRAVVVLTYWEDWEPSRVAHHLGISDGAVRRHLARARARLRKELDAGH